MSEFVAWLIFIEVLLVLGGVAGFQFADWFASQRSRSLDEREAKLRADWSALLTAQRLNAAFMEARKAMWEEAVRHGPRKPGL